jgi:NADPH:quinone reductase-like Zn-dependent oxidoreductase
MKAIVCTKYGPPEVLKLMEVEKAQPKEDEVCIKIFATAVTSSDCFVRSGKVDAKYWLPMRIAIGFGKPRRGILGMVLAGEVVSVGSKVGLFKAHDLVFGFDRFGFGTYAEYKCISEKGILTTKPAKASYDEAAAVPYGGLLALPYLRKANLQSGQRILIYGASGAVGTSAVQLAKHFGAIVVAACSAANFELVRSLGADAVLDYTTDELLNRAETFDSIFDAVGKRKTSSFKEQCKEAIRGGGKYVSVDDGSPKIRVEDLILLKELMEGGKIRAVIDRTYPLEQIVEAHRYVETGHKKGNVVLKVGT